MENGLSYKNKVQVAINHSFALNNGSFCFMVICHTLIIKESFLLSD